MSDEKDPQDEDRKGLLEGLIPDLVRKVITQGADALSGDEKFRETVVLEALRKAINKGGEVVSDLPMPNDVVDRVTGRFDDYRNDLLRLVRDELHDFFERIDLGHELQKMLTSLSLEISTEVRFIPNDKGVGAKVKPEIKSTTRVKRRKRKGKAEKRSDKSEDIEQQ